MSKNLIIIESPGKISSYEKILGSEFQIMSSFGHCVDLPKKGLSIDLKKNFEPTWAINLDKEEVINNLRKAAKKASAVYLMSDEDREGEAIAWHLKRVLEKHTSAKFFRASTNEITKAGITKAISNPGDINMQMIDAYLCRRMLDRLCGYKTSYLTKQATGGRSAGRVQSAMLRILAEREKEIKCFVPKEYWVLTAHFKTKQGEVYQGVLDDKIVIGNEAEATKIHNTIMSGTPIVASVESTEANVDPYAPFTTSTLIQASSSILGWTADKTMKVAQGLYEGGFCTYMRTDSPAMADEAVSAVRGFIDNSWGHSYLFPTVKNYAAKKGAQEGHECFRPTDILAQTIASSYDATKLYEMVWKRTVSSQMTSGKDRRIKVVTQVKDYDFISRGNTVIFDGYRKVWTYGKQQDMLLPALHKGDKPTLSQLDKEQKWTVPPSRYSDASLQKKCDSVQIARPATFASFLKTLESRGYIKRVKKSFEVTDLGLRVIDFLVSADMCFVDLKFTADMEQMLDDIAGGKKNKLSVLTDFWETLKKNIEYGKSIREQKSKTQYKCPKCSGTLLMKHSNFGSFFSCEHYKKDTGCSYTANVGKNGEPIEKVIKQKEYAAFPCEKCGNKMVKRTSKFGDFYGCEKYPSCRSIASSEGVFQPDKKKGNKKFNFKKKKKQFEQDVQDASE